MKRRCDLRPSEVVRQTNPDPAEQVPRSSIGHTAIAVGERGDDTALAACTSILYRVYLLRENPLGPGRQHTQLDFMAGRLGPGVGGRVGGGAARGAGLCASICDCGK